MTRWRQVAVLISALGIMVFLLGAGCSHSTATSTTDPPALYVPPSFDQNRALSDLQHQLALGFRIPGTAAHRATRDWLQTQLQNAGATVTLQPFSHLLGGQTVQMWNIIAEIPGKNLPATPVSVLLGAHWDSRPTADRDPDPAKRTQPIPGANDGASGVAVLLEIARQLKAHPIARNVTLVLFDGEDYGPEIDNMLLGSAYYAAHLPVNRPDWGILLDMVGDKNLDIYREPFSDEYARSVNNRVFTAADVLGYLGGANTPGFINQPFYTTIIDDHIAINKAGVPMADLIDFNYPYWHTTADTVDKCSAASLKIVGMTVLAAIQL